MPNRVTTAQLKAQIAALEAQVTELKVQTEVTDPCAHVVNWGMEYKKYSCWSGNTPTAPAVKAWIRAGRPQRA